MPQCCNSVHECRRRLQNTTRAPMSTNITREKFVSSAFGSCTCCCAPWVDVALMNGPSRLKLLTSSHYDCIAQDCWVIVFDAVYDFSPLVPGAPPELVDPVLANAGQDISHWFVRSSDGFPDVSIRHSGMVLWVHLMENLHYCTLRTHASRKWAPFARSTAPTRHYLSFVLPFMLYMRSFLALLRR